MTISTINVANMPGEIFTFIKISQEIIISTIRKLFSFNLVRKSYRNNINSLLEFKIWHTLKKNLKNS